MQQQGVIFQNSPHILPRPVTGSLSQLDSINKYSSA